MPNETEYPVDPMAAFYAAVTAVENGSVAEIGLRFEKETEHGMITMDISIRKESLPMHMLLPINQTGE